MSDEGGHSALRGHLVGGAIGLGLGVLVSALTPVSTESFWAGTFGQDDEARAVVERFWKLRAGRDWPKAADLLADSSAPPATRGPIAAVAPGALDTEVTHDRATVHIDGTEVLQPDGSCRLLKGSYSLRRSGFWAWGGTWTIVGRDTRADPLPRERAAARRWTCSHHLQDYERRLSFPVTASASSQQPGARAAAVVDGDGATFWRPRPDDERPRLHIDLGQRYPSRVTRIDISVGTTAGESAFLAADKPTRVRIASDQGESFEAFLDPTTEKPQKLRHAFRILVRSLEITVLHWESCGGGSRSTGPTISEVTVRRNTSPQSVAEPGAVGSRRRKLKPAQSAYSTDGACPQTQPAPAGTTTAVPPASTTAPIPPAGATVPPAAGTTTAAPGTP
jgi:hypothetical protein